MNATPRVLVTNVEERAALAACRALSAAGYAVIGAACASPAAGLHSRSCTGRVLLPNPRDDAAGFVTGLDDALAARRVDVVLPGTDAALLALLEYSGQLTRRNAPGLPSPAGLERALDKLTLVDIAETVGLDAPPTVACESFDDADEYAQFLGFPLLVKPRSSVNGAAGARRQRTATMVDEPKELAAAVAATGTPCLLQRAERGSVYSCGGVVADGRLLGFAFARYRRTWPPAVGSAAYSETLEPPPELEDRVRSLVVQIGWQGIFELELVGSDGPCHTIDFNPRPYGSMALAVSAGANLPAVWCDWLLGRRPPPARARAGCRYRWEEAEFRYFAWQLRRGNLARAASVLVPRPRTTHAVYRVTDPLPALVEMLRLPRRLIAKLSRPVESGARRPGSTPARRGR